MQDVSKYLNIPRETEFKEFETRLKYDWFQLKLYSMFQDLSRRSIKPGFGEFETRLEFIKFALNLCKRKDKNVKEKEYSMCLWNHHCIMSKNLQFKLGNASS